MSKEMVGGCCVCSDERGWPDNPLVYCDGSGCTVAVHQACYGIVTVPTGPWYCRKCESPENKGKARCALCPGRFGALKRTETDGWAHVVCALYIPEVRFASVTSMEPIVLSLIPPERFERKCYICEESGKPQRAGIGACMQCNKPGCKQQFHVTCAQRHGLLCEEAGNYLDNVKYCGYCFHHYSKLKRCGNVKTVPPYKPVLDESYSSDDSGDEAEAGQAAPATSEPQHHTKSKGPGRKRSHSSGSSKNSGSSGKSQASLPQPMEVSEEPEPPVTRKQKNSDKHKKKSPARRGSSAGEGSGSKNSTPAPSPQHSAESPLPTKGPAPPPASTKPPVSETPPAKPAEPVGVISSVAAATAPAPPTTDTLSTGVTTSPPAPVSSYQESVITNTGAMDTKQTKKRKAVAAAQAAAAAAAAAAATAAEQAGATANNEPAPPQQSWEQKEDYDPARKITKRSKPAENEAPAPPPPPTAHWPRTPSPRHHQSSVAGPSGMNPPAPTVPSPSQQHSQGSRSERDGQASLLVSVPLPAASYGVNLSTHQQVSLEASVSGHPGQTMHGHPARAWAGLNVQYEQQHVPHEKPGSSGMAGGSKDASSGPGAAPMPASIRNKKRAAMSAANAQSQGQPLPPPASPIQMAPTSSQSLASVRRPPQPTPPPAPLYTETVADSPPASPGERGVKKSDQSSMYRVPTAHHMLGNELNPESVVADRLQEQLTAEMAAHEAGSSGAEPLVPPPLINKAVSASTSGAQSLDQLLERHWEQGSQFLMEQAQHFDVASLLSCLHQLRTENARLQDTVSDLLHRRNHLLAVNGRLAIPLISSVGPPTRENGAPAAARPPRTETITSAHHSVPEQRQHQRAPERADERSSMRLPDSVTHLASHAQRPVNMEAQMTMREVQQKPS